MAFIYIYRSRYFMRPAILLQLFRNGFIAGYSVSFDFIYKL